MKIDVWKTYNGSAVYTNLQSPTEKPVEEENSTFADDFKKLWETKEYSGIFQWPKGDRKKTHIW